MCGWDGGKGERHRCRPCVCARARAVCVSERPSLRAVHVYAEWIHREQQEVSELPSGLSAESVSEAGFVRCWEMGATVADNTQNTE